MAFPPRGNRMSSHRIHTYCVCPPTDFHSSGGILASAASKCLPQISQNSQNFLLSVFSHRFHSKFIVEKKLPQNTQISQKFIVEKRLPQISQNSQKFIAEKRLPQISQKFIAEKRLPQNSL